MNHRAAFLLIFTLLSHNVAGAPSIRFSSTSRPEDAQYFNPLSLLASKAMGAVVKCASLACQLLPIPDFVKPSKPKLTIGKSPNYYQRDEDFSMDFED